MGGGASRETFQFQYYSGPPVPRLALGGLSRDSSPPGSARRSKKSPRRSPRRANSHSPRRPDNSPRRSPGASFKGAGRAVQASGRFAAKGSGAFDAFKLRASDFSAFGKAATNVLGLGYISKVRLIREKESRQFYVAKQMSKNDIIRKNALNQLINEKRLLSRFTSSRSPSPFIVDFVGSYQTDDYVFLVYEFLAGGELYRQMKLQKRFTNNQCKFYAAEVLCAVEYLHNVNIMHRDLKPENVMISTTGHIKLIDFGFAKGVNKKGKCYTKLGTANYLAPEMLVPQKRLSREGYGKSAEWWAFGCFVFELLTGDTAFGKSHEASREVYAQIRAGKMKKVPGYVNDDAKNLLMKLLQASPAQRPQTAAEVKRALWFQDVDWVALGDRKICPPFVRARNNCDNRRGHHPSSVDFCTRFQTCLTLATVLTLKSMTIAETGVFIKVVVAVACRSRVRQVAKDRPKTNDGRHYLTNFRTAAHCSSTVPSAECSSFLPYPTFDYLLTHTWRHTGTSTPCDQTSRRRLQQLLVDIAANHRMSFTQALKNLPWLTHNKSVYIKQKQCQKQQKCNSSIH